MLKAVSAPNMAPMAVKMVQKKRIPVSSWMEPLFEGSMPEYSQASIRPMMHVCAIVTICGAASEQQGTAQAAVGCSARNRAWRRQQRRARCPQQPTQPTLRLHPARVLAAQALHAP